VGSGSGWIPARPDRLANHLDQYNLDDLADFVDYLHTPTGPENSYYIQHAQNTVIASATWAVGKKAALARAPSAPSWGGLTQTWAQQTASKGIATTSTSARSGRRSHRFLNRRFRDDLFEEDLLWERISDAALPSPSSLPTIDKESPYQDLDTLRKVESQALDPFFSESKEVYELPAPAQPDCDEFRTVVQKWKELQGQSPDAIREQLSELVTPEGKTFYSYLWEAFEWAHLIDTPFTLLEITEMGTGIPSLIVENVGFLEESAAATIIAEDILPPLTGLLMGWFRARPGRAIEAWEQRKLVASGGCGSSCSPGTGGSREPESISATTFAPRSPRTLLEPGVDVSSADAFIPYPRSSRTASTGQEAWSAAKRLWPSRTRRRRRCRQPQLRPARSNQDAGVRRAAIRSAVVEAVARLALNIRRA
jgi:hypothetical protein